MHLYIDSTGGMNTIVPLVCVSVQTMYCSLHTVCDIFIFVCEFLILLVCRKKRPPLQVFSGVHMHIIISEPV